MGLVTPEIGLVFWMLVSFGVVFFVLKKFAWPVILKSLKEREESIDQALHEAEKARDEVARLEQRNSRMIEDLHRQREEMLKETEALKARLIAESHSQAEAERARMLSETAQLIASEKSAAAEDIKRAMAEQSVAIARLLLRKELANDAAQQQLIEDCLKDIKLPQ